MLMTFTFVAAICDGMLEEIPTVFTANGVLNALELKQVVFRHRSDVVAAMIADRRSAKCGNGLILRIRVGASASANGDREKACYGCETTSTTSHFELTSNGRGDAP